MSRSIHTDYEALRESQARAQEALVIFEKHPDADAYRVGAGFTGYAILAVEKRFSDAELAAEAWAAQCNRRVRNYDPTQDIPGVTWEWEHNIMARFATLPHFDE